VTRSLPQRISACRPFRARATSLRSLRRRHRHTDSCRSSSSRTARRRAAISCRSKARNALLYVGAALVAGLCVGVFIALLIERFDDRIFSAEGLAKAAAIPVDTIALGTPHGTIEQPVAPLLNGGLGPVPPDPDTLRAIAETTGGQFFEAKSSKSVNAAYAKLGSKLGRKPAKTEVTYAFLAAAAGLLVAAGLLSGAWSPRLP